MEELPIFHESYLEVHRASYYVHLRLSWLVVAGYPSVLMAPLGIVSYWWIPGGSKVECRSNGCYSEGLANQLGLIPEKGKKIIIKGYQNHSYRKRI